MDEIAIVLACDDRYAQHAAVAAASMLLCHTDSRPLHFYLFDDGITGVKKEMVERTIKDLKGLVTFIDTKGIAVDAYTSGHIHKAAYLRLLIAKLLPLAVAKALYFDTDLVVKDDVAKLWDFPLDGHPIGAVKDFGIMASSRMRRQKAESLGLPLGAPYFNSGVMIMDLAAFRKEGYGEKVLQCVTSHAYRHHDQDGLNKVFMGNWSILPLRWNVIPPVFGMPLKVLKKGALRLEAIEALQNPAVIHWAGRYKPWEFQISEHFNRAYYDVLKKTAFCDAPMPQPGDMTGKSLWRQEMRIRLGKIWTWLLGKK